MGVYMNRVRKQVDNVNFAKSSHVKNGLPKSAVDDKWMQAAEDARLKIKSLQQKIRQLRQAARVFEKYAQEGEPWPGESR
ncbi:MAG: hypothetical protein AB7O65_15015 [Candidatus Korobacteraceae bacterium]